MKPFLQRFALAALAFMCVLLIVAAPSRGGLGQQQRAQQTVYILVNVTGLAYAPQAAAPPEQRSGTIAARFAMRAKGSQPSVDTAVNNLSSLVAQTQTSTRVQAEVTPNPNATLLVANQTNIVLNGTAGQTVRATCVYSITSNAAAISSWTIRQGLANDFTTGWPGTALANNSYLVTPLPAATPFVVYPSAWTNMASSGNTKTYCVDLTLTIPSSVPTGAYSTTAVYTMWY